MIAVVAELDHLLLGTKDDPRRLAACVEQHSMQIDAIDDPVRILIARAKSRAADGDARQLGAGRAVAHDEKFGKKRHRMDGVLDAESAENLERVRSDLDAGADFREGRRLLEHFGIESL